MFLERERERELRWGGFIKGLGSTGGLGRVCSGQKVVIQPSSRKLGVQEGGSSPFLQAGSHCRRATAACTGRRGSSGLQVRLPGWRQQLIQQVDAAVYLLLAGAQPVHTLIQVGAHGDPCGCSTGAMPAVQPGPGVDSRRRPTWSIRVIQLVYATVHWRPCGRSTGHMRPLNWRPCGRSTPSGLPSSLRSTRPCGC